MHTDYRAALKSPLPQPPQYFWPTFSPAPNLGLQFPALGEGGPSGDPGALGRRPIPWPYTAGLGFTGIVAAPYGQPRAIAPVPIANQFAIGPNIGIISGLSK
ncbi:MAG: hypothetical protein KGJ13_12160, partial [Patescibacteria group bacterium]|nr:hypothetical protein [Patescibacteria group bacterium]